MSSRRFLTYPVPPSRARIYVQRASELHQLAQEAETRELWQGLALLTLELVVVLSDALLVRERGFRPRSSDPRELPEMLAREVPYLPDLEEALGHARRVLCRKDLLDHEPRPVGKGEARLLLTHAEAFRTWTLEALDMPGPAKSSIVR
jgi:hypothetical protein